MAAILLASFMCSCKPKSVTLIVDEYKDDRCENQWFYTYGGGLGACVKFSSPGFLRITGIRIYGTYKYNWGFKNQADNNLFTIEVRDSRLNLLFREPYKYSSYFKGFQSSFLGGGIPEDAPLWALIPVNVTVGTGSFYVIVYTNANFMVFMNKTNYGLYIGTDVCEVGGRNLFPSSSNSYLFEDGAIKRSLKFNYLIRAEGVVIPVYSIKVSTENLPESLEVTVKNATSSFTLKGGEAKVIKLVEGSSLSLEKDEVYGDDVRYKCVNPLQEVKGPEDLVFSFYPEYKVKVTFSPEEALQFATFKINGTTHRGAFSEWLKEGAVLRVEVPESIEKTGTMYVFAGYSSGEKKNVTEFRVEAPLSLVAEYKVRYYVSAESEFGSVSGEGWYDKGREAKVKLDKTLVQTSPNTRYVFSSWEPLNIESSEARFTVTKPLKLKAVWVCQYRVVARSPYSNVKPEEAWIVEGKEIRVSVEQTYVSTGFLVGKALSHWVDQHGNAYHGNPVVIKVEEPLIIEAVWVDDYTEAYVAGFAVVLVVVAAVFVKRRLVKKPLPPPPPPPPT